MGDLNQNIFGKSIYNFMPINTCIREWLPRTNESSIRIAAANERISKCPRAPALKPQEKKQICTTSRRRKRKNFARGKTPRKTGAGEVSSHKAAIKPAAPTSNPNHAPAPSTPLVLDAAADLLEPPPAE